MPETTHETSLSDSLSIEILLLTSGSGKFLLTLICDLNDIVRKENTIVASTPLRVQITVISRKGIGLQTSEVRLVLIRRTLIGITTHDITIGIIGQCTLKIGCIMQLGIHTGQQLRDSLL